jgi:hypothetical protein
VTDDDTWVAGWDALCVTLVRGLTAVEAAEAIALEDFHGFGSRGLAADWVFDSGDYNRSQFATGEVDGWTFIWEENGFQGVAREDGRLLGAASELYSMFWNVNAVMAFVAGREGRVLRHFDPLFHDDPEPSLNIGAPFDAEAGLEWSEAPRASGLALLSAVTGVSPLDPSLLDAPGARFWAHRF